MPSRPAWAFIFTRSDAYGILADGLWGPETQAQVQATQQKLNDHSHPCAIDGIPDPETHATT
ncbi:hypothetical protein [Eubacterium sp.]|uniref:hypothetical protein n=1 Tax=Eubacterium sp. TaxID=142586 RepID=UPI002FC6EFCE